MPFLLPLSLDPRGSSGPDLTAIFVSGSAEEFCLGLREILASALTLPTGPRLCRIVKSDRLAGIYLMMERAEHELSGASSVEVGNREERYRKRKILRSGSEPV